MKKRFTQAKAVAKAYDALIKLQKKKWTVANYRLAIKRHHGASVPPKGETSLAAKSADQVKRIYGKYKDKAVPSFTPWNARMEAKLSRLERGEINCVQETEIYGNAVKLNEDYIVLRLKAVSEQTRLHAL